VSTLADLLDVTLKQRSRVRQALARGRRSLLKTFTFAALHRQW
jgi:hypothetical protein